MTNSRASFLSFLELSVDHPASPYPHIGRPATANRDLIANAHIRIRRMGHTTATNAYYGHRNLVTA